MRKELLICGCAVVGGILGGKLLRKCVNKITENKSELPMPKKLKH